MVNRSRSLTGCATCRTRHLKCDEARPTCQACALTGLVCPGYNGQIKWPADGTQSPGNEKTRSEDRVFRRPLYQGIEQRLMTQTLVKSLGQSTTTTALDIIDQWYDTNSGPSFFHGPFGVIDLGQVGPVPEEASLAHHRPNIMHAGLVTSFFETSCDQSPRGTPRSYFQSLPDSPSSTQHSILESITIPPRTPELLRYFKDYVVSFSLPLRGHKNCPWQTTHLPVAMETYAELLIGNNTSHTRLSLFYSLLSMSCLRRAVRSQDSAEYERLRTLNYGMSKQHLELALEEEVAGTRKVKYKETLLSILSIVILEVSARSYHEAQRLLIEAECLIRRRGLPKYRKSSKVRVLHHIYSWLRIMAESTCGCALVRMCPARPNSSLFSNENLKQSLRNFRLTEAASLTDLDMSIPKSDAVGHHDIHLELMGGWPDSLFPSMYRIPESLMGLLSQTIRLANEQELLTRDTLVDADIVTNLNQRTKTLEHLVLSWDMDVATSNSAGNNDFNSPSASYNALAIHQSLILFYYRRVHNINAIILQETVKRATRYIEQACDSNERYELNTSLLWPCFITACEALDKTIRTILLDWLRDMFERTAFDSFAVAADVAQLVWKSREEKKDYTLSWFDVLGHDRCPIIVV